MTQDPLRRPRPLRAGLLIAASLLLLLPGVAGASRLLDDDAISLEDAGALLKDATSRLKDRKASGDERKGAVEELARLHAALDAGRREHRVLQRKVEAGLLRALVLFRAERAAPEKNLCRDTNVLAAQKLGGLAGTLGAKDRKALSTSIRERVEHVIRDKWDPESWYQPHLDATFEALAALDDKGTLKWMLESYHHTLTREVAFLIAAHQAMVKFRDVPGPLRYEICDTMITAYAGVEAVAMKNSNVPQDQAKKLFWDQVRTHTIPVVQTFARRPLNERGEALSTMREFQAWWREHKDKRKAPWRDES
jgi:hypothetical protein